MKQLEVKFRVDGKSGGSLIVEAYNSMSRRNVFQQNDILINNRKCYRYI